jgi:hypothetical protein
MFVVSYLSSLRWPQLVLRPVNFRRLKAESTSAIRPAIVPQLLWGIHLERNIEMDETCSQPGSPENSGTGGSARSLTIKTMLLAARTIKRMWGPDGGAFC